MLYLAQDGNVYFVDDNNEAYPVEITAKDKVIETRELESVNVKVQDKKVELPEGAVPTTQEALLKKFNVSEKNPILFKAAKTKATKE